MSTDTQPLTPLPTVTPAAERAIPLTRLVRVELRKMVDTRAGRWLSLLVAFGTVAAIVLYAGFASEERKTFTGYAGVALTPQGMLLPVLCILLVTSEWGQRTGLVTFTLQPRRGLVVMAKLLAAVIVGLAALVLVLAVVAAASALTGSLTQGAGGLTARSVGHLTLMQLLGILQGIGLGLLLMNSAAAIVLYFVVPTVLSLIFTLVDDMRSIAPWIDLATAQAPLGTHALTTEQWAQLATASLIWIGIPLLLGFLRLRQAEIKTG